MAEKNQWGQRVTACTEAPAPMRVDPSTIGKAKAEEKGKYSMDYSRFNVEDDAEEQEVQEMPLQMPGGPPGTVPPGMQELMRMQEMGMPPEMINAFGMREHQPPPQPVPVSKQTLADGTEIMEYKKGDIDESRLPAGRRVQSLEEVPGTAEFKARAAKHFKEAEEKMVRPEVEKQLGRVHRILENKRDDQRFRAFITKYFWAYRQDPKTLHDMRDMYADKELKWWAHANPSTKLLPVVLPEQYDWFYEIGNNDFEMIVDYFAQNNYRSFLSKCEEDIKKWAPRRPASVGGMPLDELEGVEFGPKHLKFFRAWALSRMLEVWFSQWKAGMEGEQAGCGFVGGVERFSVNAYNKLHDYKGWCDPPPGSTVEKFKTVVPKRALTTIAPAVA